MWSRIWHFSNLKTYFGWNTGNFDLEKTQKVVPLRYRLAVPPPSTSRTLPEPCTTTLLHAIPGTKPTSPKLVCWMNEKVFLTRQITSFHFYLFEQFWNEGHKTNLRIWYRRKAMRGHVSVRKKSHEILLKNRVWASFEQKNEVSKFQTLNIAVIENSKFKTRKFQPKTTKR